ncbi:MAG TPA: Ig-like domain repeat protein, partial [Streptosporangiaceae bacterium]
VTLTGDGWQSGETVALFVNDSGGQTWNWRDSVTADDSGAFADSFQLPDWFVATYTATATGTLSGTATTTFTDAVLNLKGSDGSPHQQSSQAENLGSVAVGSSLSLTCSSGGGLTVSASGLGSGNSLGWSLGYVSGFGDGSTLQPVTTLTPSSGTFSGNGQQCAGVSIATGTLTPGASYQGELEVSRTSGASANAADYFFKFTVTKRTTSTQVTCSPASLSSGSSTSCTAKVTDTSARTASTPGGTVQWTSSGAGSFDHTACTLSGGSCSASFTPSAGGSPTITGAYQGDSSHGASSGQTSLTVTSIHPTSTSVACSPAAVAVNAATTCTATVSDTGSGGTASPTGTVTFSNGPAAGTFSPAATCVLGPDSGSTATCQVSYTPALGSEGNQTLTAAYQGAVDFQGSGGSFQVAATERATSTQVNCSPATVEVNGSTTCQVTVRDTDPGSPGSPNGPVLFSGGSGSFTGSAACALSPNSDGDSASCSVAFTPALGS